MERDNELRERAAQVIPGGMYGHMSVLRRMPPEYPQYFERADGCRLWDVDGNEYIDYMCSYGPMIAGYGNPRIRAAADAQRARMDIANAPAAVIVDLAERLVQQVTHAEWAIFAKNGNDATTICVMCARARGQTRHTRRKRCVPRRPAVGELHVEGYAQRRTPVFPTLPVQ